MKEFLTVISIYTKIMIRYRATYIVSLIGEPISFIIQVILFTKIYEYNQAEVMVGYSLSQMIWYFAGVTFVWFLIWNGVDNSIANKILSGDLAIDLLRPFSIFLFELAIAAGTRITGLLMEFIPIFIMFSFISFPGFLTVLSITKFFLVVLFSFILFFNINYLVGISAFWIKSNYSLQSIKLVLISFLAGSYIPLEFYPEKIRVLVGYLPFQYLFYWPVQFFLNLEHTHGFKTLIHVLSLQLFWILLLYGFCRFAWKRAIERFCAVGG